MVNILIEIQNDIKNILFLIKEIKFWSKYDLEMYTVTFSEGHWQKLTRNNVYVK